MPLPRIDETEPPGVSDTAYSVLRMNEKDGAVTVDIAVKPRSSREGVGPIQGDRLCVAVNAPPPIWAGTTSFSDLKVSLGCNGAAIKSPYESAGLTRFKRALACLRPAFRADCLVMRPATAA